MIKRVTGIALLRKIPVKKTAKKCVFGIEIAGALGAGTVISEVPSLFENVIKAGKANSRNKKAISWEKAQANIAELNRTLIEFKAESHLIQKQKSLVLKVMKEDSAICSDTDKEKLAKKIVNLSKEYGANPLHIACIAKQETHFTENLNSKNGKGMMQITSITVKDMFLRPDFYHEKLSEITAKYTNPAELYKDIQKKPSLNLRLGIILFQARLKESNGSLRQALVNYNGSGHKYSYMESIMQDIKKYEKNYLLANR